VFNAILTEESFHRCFSSVFQRAQIKSNTSDYHTLSQEFHPSDFKKDNIYFIFLQT